MKKQTLFRVLMTLIISFAILPVSLVSAEETECKTFGRGWVFYGVEVENDGLEIVGSYHRDFFLHLHFPDTPNARRFLGIFEGTSEDWQKRLTFEACPSEGEDNSGVVWDYDIQQMNTPKGDILWNTEWGSGYYEAQQDMKNHSARVLMPYPGGEGTIVPKPTWVRIKPEQYTPTFAWLIDVGGYDIRIQDKGGYAKITFLSADITLWTGDAYHLEDFSLTLDYDQPIGLTEAGCFEGDKIVFMTVEEGGMIRFYNSNDMENFMATAPSMMFSSFCDGIARFIVTEGWDRDWEAPFVLDKTWHVQTKALVSSDW